MNRYYFTWTVLGLCLGLLFFWDGPITAAQAIAGRRVRIATMLNAKNPDKRLLTFLSANCDVENTDTRMKCTFHRASLYRPDGDGADDACVVTTAGFERAFRKDTETRWISERDLTDRCDTVLTLLRSGVPDHWDMTLHITTPAGVSSTTCPATDEVFTWDAFHVALPCRFARLSE